MKRNWSMGIALSLLAMSAQAAVPAPVRCLVYTATGDRAAAGSIEGQARGDCDSLEKRLVGGQPRGGSEEAATALACHDLANLGVGQVAICEALAYGHFASPSP